MQFHTLYSKNFYEKRQAGSRRSAEEIVPLILKLIRPQSVIDVGCGVGTWLSVFKEYGVEDILGVDGDWVNTKTLEIPEEQFFSFELNKIFRIDRKFDLVVSLEVAEHLPSECAETFVESLVGLGPVILFSAAIPFQGGIYHINEQWPEYWVKHFQEKDYVAIDCMRKYIWKNKNIEYFYAQNLLVFARQDYIEGNPSLKKECENTTISYLSVVHPRKYLETIDLMRWLHLTAQDLAALISPGEDFIFVDDAYILDLENQFGVEVAVGRHAIPFLERAGQYWGLPQDDSTAIRELERLRRSGAKFIVFGWPAFWWLDHYAELHSFLRSKFHSVLENERVIAFDLQP